MTNQTRSWLVLEQKMAHLNGGAEGFLSRGSHDDAMTGELSGFL